IFNENDSKEITVILDREGVGGDYVWGDIVGESDTIHISDISEASLTVKVIDLPEIKQMEIGAKLVDGHERFIDGDKINVFKVLHDLDSEHLNPNEKSDIVLKLTDATDDLVVLVFKNKEESETSNYTNDFTVTNLVFPKIKYKTLGEGNKNRMRFLLINSPFNYEKGYKN
ncbi:MAG: hypothetical protein MI866_03915, partial [Bacteroidales bacterium]|nr:hypothetical protein [Bacteroidales bacterium]